MSLMDKIENLQKKPEPARRKIMLVSMAVIFLLIIAVWVSTFRISLNAENTDEQKSGDQSPFAVFKNLTKDTFNTSSEIFKETLNKIKDKFYEGGE